MRATLEKSNVNESNIKYWLYKFEMSDEAAKIMEEVCSQLKLTKDELFEEAIKNAIQCAEEDPEGYKKRCLEAEQNSNLLIKQMRSYPVYKGETERQALARKLQEEAEIRNIMDKGVNKYGK